MTPRTLVDIFRNLADTPKPDLLLSKQGGKWIPISTAEFMDRVKALSSALEGLGVKQGGRVALLSENRPEWSIVDFACQCYGAVLVPIFPTMVPEQAAYLLKDSGATVAFASTPEQAAKILAAQQASPEVKQALKHVIVFEASSLPGTTPYASVVEKGRAAYAADPLAFEKRADARQPCDLATLIYTSGTTGEPKGAMLTQSNFVSNVVSACSIVPFDSSAVALSFLPLSHVFERTIEYAYYHRSCTIAYAESIDKLRDNLSEVNPHLFGAVPRVYEKVYGRVQENLSKSSPAQAEALREGGRGRKGGHPAARAEEDAGIRARAPALHLRAARVPQGARGSRLAVPVRDLRRGAPRERAGGVLLGGRRRGLRGLRPHGDEPGHRPRLPVRVAARHGGEDRARRRVPHRAGRGDPDARTARHEGLFQQAEGDRRGDRRGRLVPHGRHRPDRRGRLPHDHGPQEGDPRQLERQEHRPRADRGASSRAIPSSRCRSSSATAGSTCRASSCRTSRSSRAGRRRTASAASPWKTS